MRREMRRLRGFSLAEVLVASLVLTIGLVAVFSLAHTSATSSFDEEFRIRALVRARRLVEGYLALDPPARAGLRKGPGGELASPFGPDDAKALQDEFGGRLKLYQEKLSVETRGSVGDRPALDLLTVEVTWDSPAQQGGGRHRYVLHRLVAAEDISLHEQRPLERR